MWKLFSKHMLCIYFSCHYYIIYKNGKHFSPSVYIDFLQSISFPQHALQMLSLSMYVTMRTRLPLMQPHTISFMDSGLGFWKWKCFFLSPAFSPPPPDPGNEPGWLLVRKGRLERGKDHREIGKRMQIFSYKMSKVWGSNVKHGDYGQ